MEPKKSSKANLENKRGLFYQIGMATALLLMIGVFASSRSEKSVMPPVSAPPVDAVVEQIPITREKQPQPASVQPIIVNPQQISIVPNHRDVTTVIEWLDPGEVLLPEVSTVPETAVTGEEPPFLVVEEMPIFEGGDLAKFRSWVMSNVEYPSVALQNNISGKVTVTFVIEKDGKLSSIEVLSSPDRSLSDEVTRVLEKSPVWTPGKQRDTPVRVRFNIPVDFTLQ